MRFRIDFKIFVFILLFYFTKQIEIYSIIMCFAIIHELGHLVAGLFCGMRPDTLELTPYGVSISFKLIPKDYNKKIKNANMLELKKIFIAIAGPCTNFIIILFMLYFDTKMPSKQMIIYSNLLLILFNLLPIYPLDRRKDFKGIITYIFWKIKV